MVVKFCMGSTWVSRINCGCEFDKINQIKVSRKNLMLGFEPTTFLIQRPFSNFFFRLDTHKNWNFFLVVRDGRFIKFQNFFLKISKRIKEIPSLGKSSLQFFHVSASITKKNTFSFRISFPSLLYHTQMSRELKKRTNNFKIFL